MTDRLRIALAQLNPTVGAIARNLELAKHTLADAAGQGADVLLFSELFLTGYDWLHADSSGEATGDVAGDALGAVSNGAVSVWAGDVAV